MKKKLNKAGHDLSDKPLSDIIPKDSLDKLKRKSVKLIESNKFEESFRVKNTIPELRSQKPQDDDSEVIPSSQIEAMLEKYSKDVEEDEKFYKQKIKDKQLQAITEKEEIKIIAKEFALKRPVLQDYYEPVKAPKENKKSQDMQKNSSSQFGGGFSKDLSKIDKEKKKYVNNAITSTSVNHKVNSRTAAQLDRLTNICIEASKQDMIINEMYANVKAEKKKNEELITHLKPKKDNVIREKPVPNVPKVGLFSVDNWISKIEETDPKVLKDNISSNKKLNVEKVSAIIKNEIINN